MTVRYAHDLNYIIYSHYDPWFSITKCIVALALVVRMFPALYYSMKSVLTESKFVSAFVCAPIGRRSLCGDSKLEAFHPQLQLFVLTANCHLQPL